MRSWRRRALPRLADRGTLRRLVRERQDRLADDRGAFTAELAAGMPAVALLLITGLTAVTAVTTQLRCVDSAREAALAASRGGSGEAAGSRHAPPAASVTVVIEGERAVARVRAPVRALGARLPGLTVEGSAVAAMEPTMVGDR